MGLLGGLDIAGSIRRELEACVGHVVPPANARPIYWACMFDWTASATAANDTQRLGVVWSPRLDSALNAQANSFTVASDVPAASAEPVPTGLRVAVRCSVLVARSAAEIATLTTPASDLRQTWSINGQTPAGCLRLLCGGEYAGYYAPSGTHNHGYAGTGAMPGELPVPLLLSSGDRLTVTVESATAAVSPRVYKVCAMVRGWSWLAT